VPTCWKRDRFVPHATPDVTIQAREGTASESGQTRWRGTAARTRLDAQRHCEGQVQP
jgi:hypothetical protein